MPIIFESDTISVLKYDADILASAFYDSDEVYSSFQEEPIVVEHVFSLNKKKPASFDVELLEHHSSTAILLRCRSDVIGITATKDVNAKCKITTQRALNDNKYIIVLEDTQGDSNSSWTGTLTISAIGVDFTMALSLYGAVNVSQNKLDDGSNSEITFISSAEQSGYEVGYYLKSSAHGGNIPYSSHDDKYYKLDQKAQESEIMPMRFFNKNNGVDFNDSDFMTIESIERTFIFPTVYLHFDANPTDKYRFAVLALDTNPRGAYSADNFILFIQEPAIL